MKLRAVAIGIVGGLLIGAAVVALRGPLHPTIEPVPLAEDHGQITRVVMQYRADIGPLVTPIYTQFLAAINKDVDVIWVTGYQPDVDDLKTRLGAAWPASSSSVLVNKDISTWGKDRYVALHYPGITGKAVLCAPVRTRTANPLRTNDQEVPYRLALDVPKLFAARDTLVDFDGGDFLATTGHLFAGPTIIEKNSPEEVGATFKTLAALTEHLSQKMSSKITWLGEDPKLSPPHHIGMFLTVMGQQAAVGDVRLAEKVVAQHPEVLEALAPANGEATPEFRVDLTTRLDRIAQQMESLGYTVVRVPLLPSATTRAWMSYNNGIVETRNGETIFYMPTFGAKALDEAGAEAFRTTMGCRVIPIDCSTIWQLGGSLHCLVNVVGRK